MNRTHTVAAALALFALSACTPAAASEGRAAPTPTDSGHITVTVSLGPVIPPPAYGTVSVGDGTWMVGAEIPPGIYRAHAPRSCHFARLQLADSNGGMSPIQAFDSPPGASLLIAIEYGDRIFQTSGCGRWSPV